MLVWWSVSSQTAAHCPNRTATRGLGHTRSLYSHRIYIFFCGETQMISILKVPDKMSRMSRYSLKMD